TAPLATKRQKLSSHAWNTSGPDPPAQLVSNLSCQPLAVPSVYSTSTLGNFCLNSAIPCLARSSYVGLLRMAQSSLAGCSAAVPPLPDDGGVAPVAPRAAATNAVPPTPAAPSSRRRVQPGTRAL